MKKGIIMTVLIVCVVIVIGVVLFLKNAAFMPGCSQGRNSPDGAFTANFGTQNEKKPFAQPLTSYVVTVEMQIPTGSLVLFSSSIPESAALHDLRTKDIDDIVKWDADSGKVTFHVATQPIVVNVKELAAQPKIQKAVEWSRQQPKPK